MEAANPVIICASGPSLVRVPYEKPGYPLAAISTAIRMIPSPDYWILCDRAEEAHGEEGQAALRNDQVKKVVPGDREKVFEMFPNVEVVPRWGNKERSFMDGGPGVLTGVSRSMMFAVQWLGKHFDTLIFAGVDLNVEDPEFPWAHDYFPPRRSTTKENMARHVGCMKKGLDREYHQLRVWAPIAKEKGVRWLSWSPGSRIENFMEVFKYGR